jgi:hypothetical protein
MKDHRDLCVEVRGHDIVVTMPGTSYSVSYFKPDDFSILISKPHWKGDRQARITPVAFKKRADAAAKVRARELGWIT